MFDLIDGKYKEQREFAGDIGVTASVVSQWRRRKSSSYTKYLPQIAEALETTTEYLLTGEGKRQKEPTPVDGDGQGQNVIKIAGRDGSLIERRLTDEQVTALKLMLAQLPEVDDL